jgi:drug/metabolite transporter (DMT)-like permease
MIGAIERSMQRLYRWPSLLLGLAALFWAGNTVAARLAIDEISPLTLTALRWVMVAAVLWPVYGREIRRHWPQIRPRLALIVLLALLGMTGFNALYYVAAHDTSAINIAILQGAMPIFVLAGAYLAHGSRAGLVEQLGVFITALGVAVVATRGAPQSILQMEFNQGDLVMLAACVLYALYTVALRDRPNMPAVPFFALLALIAAITSLPLVALEVMTGTFRLPTAQGLAVTVWIAVFPSFLSQIFYLRGVDLIGPGRAGVFVNLVPVFAAVLAVGLISEPFAPYHGAALILVVGGIWLAQRRGKVPEAAHRKSPPNGP